MNTINWVKEKKAIVLTAAFILLLAMGVGAAFIKQMKEMEDRGWEMLSAGQSFAMNGESIRAHELLTELENKYGGKKMVDFGLLLQANLYAREGNWNEAVKKYNALVERKKIKALLPIATLGLAKAFEATGSPDQAIAELESYLSLYPDHFSAPYAYQGLARLYEIKGNWDKAKEYLDRLRVLFPDSIWTQRAQIKLETGAKTQGP